MTNTVVLMVVVSISLFCFSNVRLILHGNRAGVEALMWVFVFSLPFSCFVLYNGSVRDQSATLVFLILGCWITGRRGLHVGA
jgi:hypothetical protein